jgi:hypothetical protein
MLPIFPINNSIDCVSADAEMLGYADLLGSVSVHCFHGQHLRFCQLGPSVSLSAHLPALVAHVLRVLRGSPGKKMARTETGLYVALVQHGKAFWYWAIGDDPRYPMCANVLFSEIGVSISIWAESFIFRRQEAWV